MAEPEEYRCSACDTTVRSPAPPSRCPQCHREGSLAPVNKPDAETDPPAQESTRNYRRTYLALIAIAIVVVIVAGGLFTYFQKTPDGYVNSDGEQETIFGEPLNRTAIEYEIHRYANEKRQQRGLEPIAFDTDLQQIARGHSRDMVVRGYFGHVSPSGETVPDRYRAAGYDCEITTGDTIVRGDENIFVTFAGKVESPRTGEVVDYDHNETKIARGTVDWWLNSTGHRDILLKRYWERAGIGVIINSENATGTRIMITQNYC